MALWDEMCTAGCGLERWVQICVQILLHSSGNGVVDQFQFWLICPLAAHRSSQSQESSSRAEAALSSEHRWRRRLSAAVVCGSASLWRRTFALPKGPKGLSRSTKALHVKSSEKSPERSRLHTDNFMLARRSQFRHAARSYSRNTAAATRRWRDAGVYQSPLLWLVAINMATRQTIRYTSNRNEKSHAAGYCFRGKDDLSESGADKQCRQCKWSKRRLAPWYPQRRGAPKHDQLTTVSTRFGVITMDRGLGL